MPLLNYTTEVPANRSIAEITRMLQEGGASAILLENNADREISAVSFRMKTSFGLETAFTLPANVPAVIAAVNAQINAETQRQRKAPGYKRRIPMSLLNNKAQAERIAWRIVKDWLEAQMAIHQIGAAKLEQVMLPFAVDETGRTFYARLVERGSLALPAPSSP
jgi:hypothetical protein